MPCGIGISVWTMAEGSGGPVGYINVDWSKAYPSMYIPLLLLDF